MEIELEQNFGTAAMRIAAVLEARQAGSTAVSSA
jgi:hypothetical protein